MWRRILASVGGWHGLALFTVVLAYPSWMGGC